MSQTDLAKPGAILLLVGAIVSAAGALLMIGLLIGIQALLEALDGEAVGISWVYGIIGLLLAIGSALGFIGYRRANAGDLDGAFKFGLACALMPPLQILPLIGAIFCKASED